MGKALPKLVPVARLIQKAALRPVSTLPEQNHQSQPIPAAGPDGLLVAFLYCAAAAGDQQGWLLSVPAYVSYWDAETGAFQELRAITPAEFGLPSPQQEWLGTYFSPEERRTPESVSKQEQLCRCYDTLVAPFAASLIEVPLEIRTAAHEFRLLFPVLMERPLLPYYQALGGSFFDWLSRVGT